MNRERKYLIHVERSKRSIAVTSVGSVWSIHHLFRSPKYTCSELSSIPVVTCRIKLTDVDALLDTRPSIKSLLQDQCSSIHQQRKHKSGHSCPSRLNSAGVRHTRDYLSQLTFSVSISMHLVQKNMGQNRDDARTT